MQWDYAKLIKDEEVNTFQALFRREVKVWRTFLVWDRYLLLGSTLLVPRKTRLRACISVHEGVHRYRQLKTGTWKWYWKYVTSPKFRAKEESIAYFWEIAWGMLRQGRTAENMLAYYAPVLGGWFYLWAFSINDGVKEIMAMVKAIREYRGGA